MSRQQKKSDYDGEKIMREYMEVLVDAFGTPYDDRERQDKNHVSLNEVAAEFDITAMKARKLLITAGVYSTELSRKIQFLHESGKKIPEIERIVGLSRASVHSYLPYSKGSYNLQELSTNAERTKLYRERKSVRKKLQQSATADTTAMEEILWDALLLYQSYPFKTAKGLKFTYCIKGNEIFVDRKEKSITRATVNMALKNTLEAEDAITGPKKLKPLVPAIYIQSFNDLGLFARYPDCCFSILRLQ